MTLSRVVGLAMLIFLIYLPVSYVMHNVLPEQELPAQGDEEEQRDDPIVDIYCLKGLAAMGNGQFDEAIAAYTKAIGRDPKYSYAYLGRGDAYLAKGDLDRALPDYDHAFRLDPDNDAAKARADAIRAERAKQESGLGDSVP
jgi:tetratricopeptide (TPR) repeat protein